jgi:hypothetical protein
MTLQIAWSGVEKKGKTLRFPTFPEERFMVYQAIINGARGLMFFGGSLPQTIAPQDRKFGWNSFFARSSRKSGQKARCIPRSLRRIQNCRCA